MHVCVHMCMNGTPAYEGVFIHAGICGCQRLKCLPQSLLYLIF